MEHVVAMSEGEWNNYSGIYSSSSIKESDFMAQLLLGNCSSSSSSLPNHHHHEVSWHVPSLNMNMSSVAIDEPSMYSSDDNNNNGAANNNVYYYSSQGFYPPCDNHQSQEIYLNNNSSMGMDYLMVDVKNTNNLMHDGGEDYLNQEESNDENLQHNKGFLQLEMEHERKVLEEFEESSAAAEEEKIMICPSSDLSKKRSRVPIDVQKNKRNVKAKKNQKFASSSNDDEEKTRVFQRQNSTMSCCTEDDSNGSQELGGTSTSTSKGAGNAKTRASRGSATDPQSLYARKRRERINERLRILQSIVPNGTKVDISTMLEEAVQYVKFLQLQIKLLSSDDLWMYAPIAYNGMDMGLDLKIATHNL